MNTFWQYWEMFSMLKLILWSDNFERTFVWSEAISSAIQCDQSRIRARTSLIRVRAHYSLIRGSFRAYFTSTRIFERTIKWSEDKSRWVGLIRGNFCLGWEAISFWTSNWVKRAIILQYINTTAKRLQPSEFEFWLLQDMGITWKHKLLLYKIAVLCKSVRRLHGLSNLD